MLTKVLKEHLGPLGGHPHRLKASDGTSRSVTHAGGLGTRDGSRRIQTQEIRDERAEMRQTDMIPLSDPMGA